MGDDRGELEPGVLLDNRYEVVRKLAEGGMATIYLVRHLGLQSQHALKVPSPTLFQSAEARHRFTTEARIQALLRHPHIAQVTDIVVSPLPGLVMEYVEGGTLGELCGQSPGGRLPVPVLRDVFLPVLDAMGEAHAQRVVHRDLTPGNILLGRGERGRPHPKVTDFGIAKVGQEEPSQKYRTRTGALLGTRPYMSPEQIRGAAEVDARTDIFALGAILYEAATGLLAFDADSDFELMKRITEGRFLPPEQAVPELPPALCECIRKALAVDPAERFQDCAAFRAALEPALEERPAPAQPLAPVAPPPAVAAAPPVAPAPPVAAAKAPARGSWRATLSILLLVGLSGLLFVNWVQGLQEVDRLKEEHGRLQYSEKVAQQDVQRLTRERDEAVGRASQSGQASRSLQARNQQVEQELQQQAQRIDELTKLQDRSMDFMEHVLLATAVPNALSVHRVVRLCNQTDAPVTYRVQEDEAGHWSEQREIEPRACDARWLATGYQPRVPVRLIPQDGIAQQVDAMAGVVVGRMADTEVDWRPWENQLFSAPDGSLQMKWAYREPPSLRSALQQP
jgi:serine/threonine-protein kinase